MVIPKTLKILGHTFSIKLKQQNELPGNTILGTIRPHWEEIWLSEDQTEEQKECTLIHEIIEVVRSSYDLDIGHDLVCLLTESIYQVIKDNNLRFGLVNIKYTTVKILGHEYKVIEKEQKEMARSSTPGSIKENWEEIWISKEQTKNQKHKTLLYEIIEAIAYAHQLNIDKTTACMVTEFLYQVLKDNKLWFGNYINNEKMEENNEDNNFEI